MFSPVRHERLVDTRILCCSIRSGKPRLIAIDYDTISLAMIDRQQQREMPASAKYIRCSYSVAEEMYPASWIILLRRTDAALIQHYMVCILLYGVDISTLAMLMRRMPLLQGMDFSVMKFSCVLLLSSVELSPD